MTRVRIAVGVVTFSLVAVGGVPTVAHGAKAESRARAPQRVLIISLPAVTWADVDARRTPTLLRLLDESAVAGLSTRAATGPAHLGNGYATLGAGARSDTERATDGEALEAQERYGDSTASVEFRRRTGLSVSHGLVHLGVATLVDTNDALPFDAKIGSLGNALDRAGFHRAVVANADGVEPDTPKAPVYERPAVAALMKSNGTVPAGAVGPELLEAAPEDPFGLRLSNSEVEQAFDAVWRRRSVVLVEASDTARADAYRPQTTPPERERQWDRALRHTDELVSRLLAHVERRRDAVVVVGPAHPSSASALTIAAVRAPGVHPGLLQSGTTRRAGYASLVDIAPTILSLLEVPRPDAMEGRALVHVGRHGSAANRRKFLVDANRSSLFRDNLVDSVTLAYVVMAIVLLAASVVFGRLAPARRWLRYGALALIGFLVATWLAGPFHFAEHGGDTAYWLFLVAVALGFVVGCVLAGRGSRLDPLMLALGGLALLLVLDAYTGTHFELDTVFGYSATVGIRFAGVSNLAFAQLSIAVIALAALIVWRVDGRRGVVVAVAVLAISFVALTPPLFGQDLGGTLAAVPAFGLLGWMITGRTLRLRTGLALAGVPLGVGLLVGFLDLLRPSGQRTHVGRLFEQIGHKGLPGFFTVVQRKATENLDTLGQTHWLVLIAIVIVAIGYGWRWSTRPVRRALEAVPPLRVAGIAAAVVAVLGYALNDSGVAIPGMMLGVIAATLVYIAAAIDEPVGGPRADGAALAHTARSA